jgi:diketogulonate reductase-like aldo/keto reductase
MDVHPIVSLGISNMQIDKARNKLNWNGAEITANQIVRSQISESIVFCTPLPVPFETLVL